MSEIRSSEMVVEAFGPVGLTDAARAGIAEENLSAALMQRDGVHEALSDLRERLAALAAREEYIGGGSAAHRIRAVLDGSYDPRPDADRCGLDYR